MNRFIIATLLIFAFATAEAQFKSGGLGYFSLGWDFSSQPALQDNLEQGNWPGSSNLASSFSVGGGGFSLFNKWGIFIGHGFSSRFVTQQEGLVRVRQSMGGGGMGLGYAILNRNDLLVFPSVQFCGLGQSLILENGSPQSRSFGSDVLNTGESNSYETGFWYLDMGLSAHKLFRLNGESGGRVISIGFSMGYRKGLDTGDWSTENTEQNLSNVAPQGLNNAYFRINLGLGGFNE